MTRHFAIASLWSRFMPLGLATGLLLLGAGSLAGEPRTGGSEEILPARPFLRWERSGYRNFALSHYVNYPNHTIPYEDSPRAYYGPMGDFLITGYDLYSWNETRFPGQEFGSSIYKPNEMYQLIWEKVYDALVVGRDGYGSWGYSLMVGDGMVARLSPLTLSRTNFNGMRMDLSTPYLQLTGMASRIERPHNYQEVPAPWAIEKTHYADDSVLLLGSRLQLDLGTLRLGLNGSNAHIYQSTQPGNSLKGRLRPDQPLMDWIVVRFSDDSPRDAMGGAAVEEVRLVVNGEVRPDLVPQVVRHWGGLTPQVGSVLQATGRFRAQDYTAFRGARLFYRDRDEIPLYSDYFYRLDHEAGIDVSKATNLKSLVEHIQVESPGGLLRADGEDKLVFLFDVSGESRVESVEVEALLGNDYRVEVAMLNHQDPRGKTYHAQYLTTFYRTALRAAGNVRDMSNFRRVRFKVGEDTGIFTYSADVKLSLPGLEVMGEFGRSALYSRYPAQQEGIPLFDETPPFSQHGSAGYINALHWFGRGRVGAELFSINPDFSTTMRTYMLREVSLWNGPFMGIYNDTVYWDLVQDNDDGDRFPDRRVGNLVGFTNDSQDYDLDGVTLAQDEDNDGLPEVNRDGDFLPDYEEPFLMYDVEPNVYVYGLDRNHNDEPDQREDDTENDYPYDRDQRGYHLFGQVDLAGHWSLAAGHYATAQIASHGRTRSTYALLTYQRQGIGRLQRLFFETGLRRVEDDIPDDFVVLDELPDRSSLFSFRGLSAPNTIEFFGQDRPPIFSSTIVADLMPYQDSYVNETYLEGRFKLWSRLNVVEKLRLRFNWQQGGELRPGIFQRRSRLDFWAWVSRTDYTWTWGRLSLTPQYKFMLLRSTDRDLGRDYLDEMRSIPILRLDYALLPRTTLKVGIQGLGPLPYRRRDRVAERNSFDQHTVFATLTNYTRYFGYELMTTAGVRRNEKDFEAEIQRFREFDSWSFFVRTIVGFSEFGRPL